ncbi:MAG TPA: hypothetical protein VNW50_23250 [Streptosporangiaceae bacterium]|nr:hypothetical protein [Streptosporangiaceae bacterium]
MPGEADIEAFIVLGNALGPSDGVVHHDVCAPCASQLYLWVAEHHPEWLKKPL